MGTSKRGNVLLGLALTPHRSKFVIASGGRTANLLPVVTSMRRAVAPVRND